MPEGETGQSARTAPDTETFRLRRFVEALVGSGEIEVCEEKLELADLAARLDGNPEAVLFRRDGREVLIALGELRKEGLISRLAESEYALKPTKGKAHLVGSIARILAHSSWVEQSRRHYQSTQFFSAFFSSGVPCKLRRCSACSFEITT